MSKLVSIDWHPTDRTLRQFGFIALGGFGLLAWAAWQEAAMFRAGLGAAREPVSIALLAVGCLAALFSLVAPRWNRAIYLGITVLSYPIGFIGSYVVLAALFFGVFTPVAIVFRLIGRDAMQRRFTPRASYWSECRRNREPKSYFSQF